MSRRLRLPSRAAWLGARATNVLRRPRRAASVGVVAFVVLLTGYLVLPRGVVGLRAAFRPSVGARIDTTPLADHVRQARTALVRAEGVLRIRREAFVISHRAVVRPSARMTDPSSRDSTERLLAVLTSSLERATTSPLPESYRALGESAALRNDPRVRVLLDSLADVEREREDLGGGIAVDPVFVALTTRASALGRAIAAIGAEELARLRSTTAPVVSVTSAPTAAFIRPPLPDTLEAARAVRDAQVGLVTTERVLASSRLTNATRDTVAVRERERTQLAPLPILFVGAAVVAGFLAFALSLADEMRSPRVADAAEAERLSGLRVLTVARWRSVPLERSRRAADRDLSSVLDPTSDEYRMLAWHLTSWWPRDGIVPVTGDDPVVSALIAANVAAVLCVDARATLLVDTDFVAAPLAMVLQLPRSPGLAAVVENRRKWSESLITVPVGRGRTMDVLPSGHRERSLGPAEGRALAQDVARAARRHDATVVIAPASHILRSRAGDDVIVCAVQGATRLATLARAVASLIDAGARVRGVVLWEGRVPPLPRAA